MKKIILLILLIFLVGCSENSDETITSEKKCGDSVCDQAEQESGFCPEDCEAAEETAESSSELSADAQMAFFYQTVGPFINGIGENAVMIGSTEDGSVIESFDQTAVAWEQGVEKTTGYDDPVFSRLSDSWTLTSWSANEDPRGAGAMLYFEASCPFVDDEEVIALKPSTEAGCQESTHMQIGKTSQVFSAEGGTYVFHSIMAKVYLSHLSDEEHQAMDLESLCILEDPVTELSELDYGETTLVVSDDDLLLSDTAIGQRADGTWVLFVKGIENTKECQAGSLCELCARSIYRTTSSDLIEWSPLEKVVEQASIPEATSLNGTIWLYWQDFSNACEKQDISASMRVNISFSYELPDSYEFSEKDSVIFSDEAFETDKSIHYATNGNPIALDDDARESLIECFEE